MEKLIAKLKHQRTALDETLRKLEDLLSVSSSEQVRI